MRYSMIVGRICLFFFGAITSLALAEPMQLAGTEKLTLPDDIVAAQLEQVNQYWLRRIAEATRLRDRVWKPDFTSPEAYEKSVAPHRERCRRMLGLPEDRPRIGKPTIDVIADEASCRIERVTVPIADGLRARGLLFLPKTAGPYRLVIACGDADTWPERFSGLDGNSAPAAWFTDLLSRGTAVYFPQSIERLQDHPFCKTTKGKDRRMILHRLGYVVGRTMTGLDVQDVVAATDYLLGRSDMDPRQVAMAGVGQGGMTALCAAAVDVRVKAGAVIDYFENHERFWEEPVDRRLPGRLLEFGDAELAALIAPRALICIRGSDAPMTEHSVRQEFERARGFYARLRAPTPLILVSDVPAPDRMGTSFTVLADILSSPKPIRPAVVPKLRVADDRALAVRNRHFDERVNYLHTLIAESESARERCWAITTRPAEEFESIRRAMLDDYRRLVGEVPLAKTPLNAKTRLALITDKYEAYRVMLDVADGVQVYGNLLIPRNVEGRVPAVICQHGLNGLPEMITGLGLKEDTPYHEYGKRLAERGYVVFAPLLLHHHPVKQVNDQVRMAEAVGAMRIAMPIAKTNRVIDFLRTLPCVDPNRIGYYGLSYGGYSAIWMAPLVDRLSAIVISGHFNDWRTKITNEKEGTSFLQHPDEDFYNWDILHRFTHPELIAMALPRPVCVEFGEHDGITTPQWTDYAWKQVVAIRDHLKQTDRVWLAHYDGVHEVHGVESFDFLDRFLWPERTVGRDFEYTMLGTKVNALTQVIDLPFVKQTLDSAPESWLRGRFWLPVGAKESRGMAVKLMSTGHPAPLEARFGTAPGRDDLGTATLAPEQMAPLFEQWYELTVTPRSLPAGEFIYYELRCSGGKAPADCYTFWGPRPLGGKDYPERFGLSYRVLTERPQDALDVPGKQHPFAHVRAMTGPFYPDKPTGELRGSTPRANETVIDSEWQIQFAEDAERMVQTAAEDLQQFLRTQAEINVDLTSLAQTGRSKLIALAIPNDPTFVKDLTADEDYHIDVRDRRIIISGRTPRGVMRGVYWLEDMMRFRGAPCLKQGATVRNCRFGRRIVCSVVPGGTKYTELARPLIYTDGLLQRISHQGFNGVWIWTSLDEIALKTKVFPELDNPAARQSFERLNDLCRRAKRFGIDVYGYLSWCEDFRIPDSFYAKHPDAKGVAWNNSMCPSNPQVRQYYAEVITGLFQNVPDLKGLIGIFDSEGLYHCGTFDSLRKTCPRCKNRTCEDISLELVLTLRDAVRAGGGPSKDWIVWPYGGGVPEPWVMKVIEGLSRDMLFQADFTKGTIAEKDGIKHITGDYNISNIGPPDHFVQEYNAAKKRGLGVMAKTEHAVSQEFITVPYIPCMQQWHRRMEAMLKFDLAGLLANWCHYGYTPSRPAEIMMWYSWAPAPPINELLANLARRDFGDPAVPYAISAWDHFSKGIQHYPYSDFVSRTPGPIQKGPTQPLFLDPNVKPGLPWRSWQNDLKWTQPWGPAIAAKHLRLLEEEYIAGLADLAKARELTTDAVHRVELDREIGIARTIQASVHSVLNLIEWVPIRDVYVKTPPGPERDKLRERLLAIARDELANARAALPAVEADSRLGASSEGGGMQPGGLFSPALIRHKIGLTEDLIERQLAVDETPR